MKTLKDFPAAVNAVGGEQNMVNLLQYMSRTFLDLGYPAQIVAAFYGIDLNEPRYWDGRLINGNPISKKQFTYLRAKNINPNGLDAAGASAILERTYEDGGIHLRLRANKWYKELMDLIPREFVQYPKDFTVVDVSFTPKKVAAVEDAFTAE